MFSAFPDGGAPSRVLTSSYQRPRCILLTSSFLWIVLSFGRYFLDSGIVAVWCCVDAYLLLGTTLFVLTVNVLWHHRERYLGSVQPQMDATQITHCLAILYYKEPERMLYELVDSLAKQEAKGKKVLIVGMERGTPNQAEKAQKIEAEFGHAFDKILYTIHHIRPGEIPGTGSNHFETQVAAELHFQDRSNVIFTKFDCNMKVAGPLLLEMEAVWCSVDASTRHSITFMPNVVWSTDVPDSRRACLEIGLSCFMNSMLNIMPFAMAFVSGSLSGAIEAGYTPPALLAEDELMFMKKVALLPGSSTYRLSSTIMKIFYPNDVGSIQFPSKIMAPKLARWFTGWVEVHAYFLTWLFCGVRDHPRVKNRFKTFAYLCATILRLYLAIAVGMTLQVNPIYFTMRYLAGYDPFFTPAKIANFCGCAVALVCSIVVIFSVQTRLYKTFECLKFRRRTLVVAPVMAGCYLAVVPYYIMWSYLKHGFLNRPVVHKAVEDHVKETVVGLLEKDADLEMAKPIQAVSNHPPEWTPEMVDKNDISPTKEIDPPLSTPPMLIEWLGMPHAKNVFGNPDVDEQILLVLNRFATNHSFPTSPSKCTSPHRLGTSPPRLGVPETETSK
eukprot:gnl/TRDRNA2_/TRDRNA2_63175_c0_seq1.p1 gnl/TRDRNA2_/TRDRNA2_63175_c0~~gnl/TRDRNA2_/TRDRNA2_63175_c0_seq1.p1  ORF type:complete len:613 (-),score=73.82 gnl/TRDRNA2_/TRDRNA2_63175_c0_seq1:204-2042(-)